MRLFKYYFSRKEVDYIVTSLRFLLPQLGENERHIVAVLLHTLQQVPSQEYIEPKCKECIKFIVKCFKARLPTFMR